MIGLFDNSIRRLGKYIWFVFIFLLLVGCEKGPGKVRLKPSHIIVDAGENVIYRPFCRIKSGVYR